ncbi:MAG TPA: acyl-CoA dehydrogenase family protein, partial [Bacillota bacterium]|nr:acyl-CoA dehydrogenase family protein [Bacillota bacterium]
MNFELTNEQKMTQEMVRDFAETVIKPRAIEIDKT